MRSTRVALFLAIGALPLSLLARAEPVDDGQILADAQDAGTDLAPPAAGYAPDPAPLVTRHQWVVDLRYRSGSLVYGGSRRVDLAQPTPTPRRMGRFALELYVGPQLLERVRFDFPLLGADELGGSPRRWDSAPSFERKLSSQAAVMIPQSERATRATLVDRATGRAWVLPWPLTSPAPARIADGGRES